MERLFCCDVNDRFLIDIVKNKPDANLEDESDDIEVWRSIFKYFNKKSNINLKIAPESINDQFLESMANNPEYSLLKKMIDKSFNSESVKLDLSNKNIGQELLNSPSFYFNEDPECFEYNKLGVENFTITGIAKEWVKYYKSNTIRIHEQNVIGSRNGWEFLNRFKHSCNSLLICDNYLLSTRAKMVDNLIPILKILLPENQLKVIIELMIVSSYFYNCYSEIDHKYERPNKYHLQEIEKEIVKILKNKIGENHLKLSIVYKNLNQYHDRHIFTNSFVLKSGNSFTYFDKFGNSILPSPTTLDICPYQADNLEATYGHEYFPLIKNICEITKNSKIFIGSKELRLFQFPKP